MMPFSRLFRVVLFLLSGSLVLLSSASQAQDSTASATQTVLAQVDYMKVEPDRIAEYLSVEREIWKPLHEERVRDGQVLGWSLYTVRYPGGTSHDYNFVTVTFHEGLESIETPNFAAYADRALPGVNGAVAMQRTTTARELVRSELWVQHDVVTPEAPPSSPPSFLRLDYMKVSPGKEDDYMRLERDLWKPVNQARVDAEKIANWGLYQMVIPAGTAQRHNFGTVTGFRSMSDLPASYPENVWATVHPEKNVEQIMERTTAARDLVHMELWELVDSVDGTPTADR